MIINDATLRTTRQQHQALFYEEVRATKPIWPLFCMLQTLTKGDQMTFHWAENHRMARRWEGPRVINAPRHESVTIALGKPWENSIGIKRTELEDDATEVMARRVKGFGGASVAFRDWRATDQLCRGFTTINSNDGVTYFNANHPREGGLAVQANSHAGALSPATFNTRMAAMMARTDRYGNPLGIVPNILMAGPKNREMVKTILMADTIPHTIDAVSSQMTNINRGALEGVINPYLVDGWDDYWFLFDTTGMAPAWVFLERTQTEFQAQDTPASTAFFENDEVRYGTRDRFEVGPGGWWAADGGAL